MTRTPDQADNTSETGSGKRASAGKFVAAIALVLVLAIVAVVAYLSLAGEEAPPTEQRAGHPSYASGQPCLECHPDPHTGTLYASKTCDTCHGLNSWRVVQHEHLNQDSTDKNTADGDGGAEMDLGIHSVVGCERCHPIVQVEATVTVNGSTVSTVGVGGKKPAPDPSCQNCHKPVHAGSVNCATCHTPLSWRTNRPLPEGHWPLIGKHLNVNCLGCHIRAEKPSTRCNSCHPSPHGTSVTACERCHSPIGWNVVDFNHSTTGFTLNKAHQAIPCQSCHVRGFTRAASCTQCHKSPHGAGFDDCSRCHETSFASASFSHASTGFSLTGAHSKLACTKCHPGLKFGTPKSGACGNCHRNPHGAGVPTCTKCHNTTTFSRVSFNHVANTGFGITGDHTRLSCRSCHTTLSFSTVRSCASCHGTPHGAAWGACYSCHSKADVRNITFDHTKAAAYTLHAPHNTFACSKCHAVSSANLSQFSSLQTNVCSQCHNPPHGPGYGGCYQCHMTDGFVPATPVQHPATVPLIGGHATAACTDCHGVSATFPQGPVFVPTPPNQCSGCHTSPHGGPDTCGDCHNPTGWGNVSFVHPDISFHTGSAAVINETCSNCHPGNNFATYQCTPCHQGMTYPPANRRR